MDDKFIYVFSEADMEKLSSRGYKLLKSDVKNNIFVFEALGVDGEARFLLNDVSYMPSNKLTF